MGRTNVGRTRRAAMVGLVAVALASLIALADGLPVGAVVGAPDIHVGTDPNRAGAVVNFTPPNLGSPTGCNWAPGSFFPIGTTTVICAPIDSNGGTNAALFSVVVTDTQAPTIDGAPPITVTAAAGTGSATVHYRVPAVHDNDPHTAASCVPASGSAFSVGTTHVTCTATDSGGNTARTTFDVTTRSSAPVATAPPVTAPPATIAVPQTRPSSGGPAQPGQGGPPANGGFPQAPFPQGGAPLGTTTSSTTELATISVPPPFPTLAPSTVPAKHPAAVGGGPSAGGKAPTTFPKRDESVLKKRGGPSAKVAAIGSLSVLTAAIVLTLLAKLRLDREPI